jgi:GNAT superfamily N-acetyltransferase
MKITIRTASVEDIPALADLTDAAVRELSAGFYGPQQIEIALRHVFGADTRQLIADGTYYIAEIDGQIVGAGGWSRRATHYSGEQATGAAAALLDPARDAARIRAFYVHPRWTRRGLGRRLLQQCEAAARAAGFTRLELVATLMGVPLYTAGGFVAIKPINVPLPDGVALPCIQMAKTLHAQVPVPNPANARTPWPTTPF